MVTSPLFVGTWENGYVCRYRNLSTDITHSSIRLSTLEEEEKADIIQGVFPHIRLFQFADKNGHIQVGGLPEEVNCISAPIGSFRHFGTRHLAS